MYEEVHSIAYTPPPIALKGVPKEDVSPSSTPQPAEFAPVLVSYVQFVVCTVPVSTEDDPGTLHLPAVCKEVKTCV